MIVHLPKLLLLFLVLLQPATADQRAPELDTLFETLQAPQTTPGKAKQITGEIWTYWLKAETPKAQQLMDLGIAQMNEFALDQAAQTFTDLIDIEPEYAEAWNKRATVLYLMGEYELSSSDVRETLRLEPRHFGAISGQGLIYMQVDRKAEALYWFRRALLLNPFMEGVLQNVEVLEESLNGKLI